MSNSLIENNELTTLASNPNHSKNSGDYQPFLGIGEGRAKAKTAAGKAASSSTPDANWKSSVERAYGILKGNKAGSNTALSRISKKENIDNIFLATKDFGIPTDKKSIDFHNGAVGVYLKYDYAGIGAGKADCLLLNDFIGKVEADIEAANTRLSAGSADADKGEIQALTKVQSKIKSMIAENRCVEKAEALEQQKSKEETLATLKAATQSTDKADNTIKYFAYGLGGLIILTGIVLLIKNR